MQNPIVTVTRVGGWWLPVAVGWLDAGCGAVES